MALVGMKRNFDLTVGSDSSRDLTSECQSKRLCVEQRLKQNSFCSEWNTVEMECQTYSTRPDELEGCPSYEESPVASFNNNNNGNNSSQLHQGQSVCLRCEAGEPGHIRHIAQ